MLFYATNLHIRQGASFPRISACWIVHSCAFQAQTLRSGDTDSNFTSVHLLGLIFWHLALYGTVLYCTGLYLIRTSCVPPLHRSHPPYEVTLFFHTVFFIAFLNAIRT